MGIKLYPPIIPATLDAMYNEFNLFIKIKIPFELNRAVSLSDITDFQILVKSLVSNKVIFEFLISSTTTSILINTMKHFKTVEGYLPNEADATLTAGEYYKIQLAFVNNDTVGYYSTVATIKYTKLPEVTIQNLDAAAATNPFTYTFLGNFNNDEEPTETRSFYCFEIFSNFEDGGIPGDLILSSGWLIRDPDKEQDTYTFDDIEGCTIYKLKYSVKTINNLIVESPYYRVEQAEVASDIEQDYDVVVENNFDNAYVIARIQPKESLSLDPQNVDGMFRLLRRSSLEDRFIEVGRKHIVLNNNNHYTAEFEDFLIEQGETYEYKVLQYNERNIYSIKKPDTAAGEVPAIITVDFEDSFLWDGEKLLKLRFNPKVSSFKIDRQELKMETSGSQFPFFTRNGKIAYHEFPISGLCSYLMDEELLFMKDNELGLINDPITISDARQQTAHSSDEDSAQRRGRTTNLVNYNFLAERRFKNKVLEWLGNGKPKFYKSPSEGNFIIRLMNPSLSPEDKTNRMIHNFSATAYELMEINSKNLLENKFYKNNDEDDFVGSGRVFNKISQIKNLNNNILILFPDPGDQNINPQTPTNPEQTSRTEDALLSWFGDKTNIKQIKIKIRQMKEVNSIEWASSYHSTISPRVTISPAIYNNDFTLRFKDSQNNNIPISISQVYYCAAAFDNSNNHPSEFNTLGLNDYKSLIYLNPETTELATISPNSSTRFRLISMSNTSSPYIVFKKTTSVHTPYLQFEEATGVTENNFTNYYIQSTDSQTGKIIYISAQGTTYHEETIYYRRTSNRDATKCDNPIEFGSYQSLELRSEYIVDNIKDFLNRCIYIHYALYFEIIYYNKYQAIYDLN